MNISEINNLKISFDLAKATKSFHTNPTRNFIQMGVLTNNDDPLYLSLKGVCNADRLYYTSAFKKHQFSIPMELNVRPEVNEFFEKLSNMVQGVVPEWQVTTPLSRDDFWLRLNFDEKSKKFKTRSNLNFTTVKSVEKIVGLKDKKMDVTVELKAWFNLKDEKAGVSINVIEADFE